MKVSLVKEVRLLLRCRLVQRKGTEDNLRTIQERQQALLSAIPDLIFRHTKDGTYLDYHAPRLDMLLMPPEQFLGRAIKEVLPTDVAERCHRSLRL